MGGERKEALGFRLRETEKVVYSNYDPGTKEWGDLVLTDWNDKSFWPSPRSIGVNYAVSVFEGLKAFRQNGKVYIFRLPDHAKRFNRSLSGIIMPSLPEDKFIAATKKLVKANIKSVPEYREGSLYIRVICYGGDGLGISFDPEVSYTAAFWCNPVGEYLSSQGISVWVYLKPPRATEGGLGSFKAAGNYLPVRVIKERAKKEGCDDALGLSEKRGLFQRRFIQELTAANIFIVKDNALYTPLLKDTILPGITRASIMTIAKKKMLIRVFEKDITVKELLKFDEVFCCGTAAIITPIVKVKYKGKMYIIGDGKPGGLTERLYDFLTGIQYGDKEDIFGWLTEVEV